MTVVENVRLEAAVQEVVASAVTLRLWSEVAQRVYLLKHVTEIESLLDSPTFTSLPDLAGTVAPEAIRSALGEVDQATSRAADAARSVCDGMVNSPGAEKSVADVKNLVDTAIQTTVADVSDAKHKVESNGAVVEDAARAVGNHIERIFEDTFMSIQSLASVLTADQPDVSNSAPPEAA